jgi:hypothetical protein
MTTLQKDIEALINRHSRENESNTPDYILATFMLDCLRAFELASRERERWYNMHCEPGGVRRVDPDPEEKS